METPLSLYIHIPFCVSKCRYCDFYSIPRLESASCYIDALLREWKHVFKHNNIDKYILSTLFVGGGTPSLLDEELWIKLTQGIFSLIERAPELEWTVECNPDSFTREKGELFAGLGVTRLTFGVQSMDDRELRLLGRPHLSARVRSVLGDPVLRRFVSVGADLMYGLPGQTTERCERSLNEILEYACVNHVSLYELALNPATPFGRHRSLLPLPGEDEVVAMDAAISAIMSGHGFARYEISNYAKPGHRCRHNETYWDHRPYIGLGCGAHSYIHPARWANLKDVEQYIEALSRDGGVVDFKETLDADSLAREMIFLGLRRMEGIDEKAFLNATGKIFSHGRRSHTLELLVKQGTIAQVSGGWALTDRGMLLADAIARELID